MRAIAAAFLCLCLTVGCDKKSEKETLPAEQRLLTFADDDAFLDYIQRTHLNYMWDGAEPTSGLAPERIHIDGVYPQNDADVVTTGGSGFGLAGLLVAVERGFIPRLCRRKSVV